METSLNNIFDSVIIHFSGEIWLKKVWTRKYYEKRLARNLKKTLNHYNIPYTELVRRHSRFYLRTNSAMEATYNLARVFGISSVSAAIETRSKLEDVLEKSLLLAKTLLNVGNSFAVKCKRVGNQNYSSDDIRKLVGQKILDELGKKLDLRVDLGNPDLTLGVEIRDKQAFIYSKTVKGIGGMPLGVQPRLIGLFSGGIDSTCSLLKRKENPPVLYSIIGGVIPSNNEEFIHNFKEVYTNLANIKKTKIHFIETNLRDLLNEPLLTYKFRNEINEWSWWEALNLALVQLSLCAPLSVKEVNQLIISSSNATKINLKSKLLLFRL